MKNNFCGGRKKSDLRTIAARLNVAKEKYAVIIALPAQSCLHKLWVLRRQAPTAFHPELDPSIERVARQRLLEIDALPRGEQLEALVTFQGQIPNSLFSEVEKRIADFRGKR